MKKHSLFFTVFAIFLVFPSAASTNNFKPRDVRKHGNWESAIVRIVDEFPVAYAYSHPDNPSLSQCAVAMLPGTCGWGVLAITIRNRNRSQDKFPRSIQGTLCIDNGKIVDLSFDVMYEGNDVMVACYLNESLVNKLISGRNITITLAKHPLVSEKEYSVLQYFLSGFPEAYQRVSSLCKDMSSTADNEK